MSHPLKGKKPTAAAIQAAVSRVHSLWDMAQDRYGQLGPCPVVKFDLRGRAAGQARKQGNKSILRINLEAYALDPEDMLNETIPHEVAHLVCFAAPHLGRNHDSGWRSVCVSLGGNGDRCHTIQLTPVRPPKRKVRHIYDVMGEICTLGPIQHKNLQAGRARYGTRSGVEVQRWHYTGETK